MFEHRSQIHIDLAERAVYSGLPADPVAVCHLLERQESDADSERGDFVDRVVAAHKTIGGAYTAALDQLQARLATLRARLTSGACVLEEETLADLERGAKAIDAAITDAYDELLP